MGLYYDSLEPAVRQNIVVHEKRAKKEATVISYFLMTSEWHACVLDMLDDHCHCCHSVGCRLQFHMWLKLFFMILLK